MTRRVNAARYGEAGPWTVNLGPPSAFDASEETLADRYSATARLRQSDGAVLALTVTDRVSGATFGWTNRGVTMKVADDETAESCARLLRDGRDILGLARRQTGGPLGGTGLTLAALIDAAIKDREPDGSWPTEVALAQEVDRDIRTVRRIAARASGTGKPYDRMIALATRRVQAES